MGLNNMGLGFVFTARDLASGKMQRLEHRFSSLDERVTGGTDRMTTAFRQLGIGLAVFTAGAVAVAGAFALANAAGRFEQGLAAIGAVTRATTRELGMLRLNRFLGERVPGLRPASGYRDRITRALVEQSAALRQELGIPADCFLRQR